MSITPLMPVYPRCGFRPVRGEGAWLISEDGSRALFEIITTPMASEAGQPRGLLGVARGTLSSKMAKSSRSSLGSPSISRTSTTVRPIMSSGKPPCAKLPSKLPWLSTVNSLSA